MCTCRPPVQAVATRSGLRPNAAGCSNFASRAALGLLRMVATVPPSVGFGGCCSSALLRAACRAFRCLVYLRPSSRPLSVPSGYVWASMAASVPGAVPGFGLLSGGCRWCIIGSCRRLRQPPPLRIPVSAGDTRRPLC